MGGCHLPRAATAPRWHGDAQGAGRKVGWGGLCSPLGQKMVMVGKIGAGGLTLRPPDSSLFSLHPCLMMPPPFGTCSPPKIIRPAAAWGAPDGIPQGTPGSPAGSGTEIKFYLIIVSVTARDRAGTAKIASFYGNQESGGIVSLERAPSPSVPSPVTPQVRDRGRTGGVLGTKRM